MKNLYDVPAPAKLNLFLHIIGRRHDGYHLLQSVFALVSLCDSLDFEVLARPSITREDTAPPEASPLPTEDLAVRAAKLLQTTTGCQRGVHIRLHKRVPEQAGLGGGSSDAASTLLALNQLWRTGLDREALMRLGRQLGADVPFFLFGQNAWAEGTGDLLTPVQVPTHPVWIVKPRSGLSTPAIFQDPGLKRDSKPATIEGFADLDDREKFSYGRNDLQRVAEKQSTELRECVEWLNSAGHKCRMTGSGSAVFVVCPSGEIPPDLPLGWFTAKASVLPEHPLRHWAS